MLAYCERSGVTYNPDEPFIEYADLTKADVVGWLEAGLDVDNMKSNLDRLNFDATILNKDFTHFKENEKYDFIILDAPCSAIGTIRKNPEIFFKRTGPNFKELLVLQKKMLEKASNLLNINGLVLYMVCSFLKIETMDQINRFLYNHFFLLY